MAVQKVQPVLAPEPLIGLAHDIEGGGRIPKKEVDGDVLGDVPDNQRLCLGRGVLCWPSASTENFRGLSTFILCPLPTSPQLSSLSVPPMSQEGEPPSVYKTDNVPVGDPEAVRISNAIDEELKVC